MGEGIRKSKAYETKLTKEQYDEVNRLFWTNKISEKESTWKVLQTICESDYSKLHT